MSSLLITHLHNSAQKAFIYTRRISTPQTPVILESLHPKHLLYYHFCNQSSPCSPLVNVLQATIRLIIFYLFIVEKIETMVREGGGVDLPL